MSAIQQSQSDGPAAGFSAPAAGAEVPEPGNLTELITEHPRERFHEIFADSLHLLRHFSLTSPNPAQVEHLNQLLQDPERRAVARAYLRQANAFNFRYPGQAEALFYGLSQHIDEQPQEMLAFFAESLGKTKDEAEHLKFVGDLFLQYDPPAEVADAAVRYFAGQNCYNVERLPEFKPWIEYLSNEATEDQIALIADELANRIKRNHMSSYDHLLFVLSRSNHPSAKQRLEQLLGVQQERNSQTAEAVPGKSQEPSFVVEMQKKAVMYLAVFTVMSLLLNRSEYSTTTFLIDLFGSQGWAYLFTRLGWARRTSEEAEHASKQPKFHTRARNYFGQRVFNIMENRVGSNDPAASDFLTRMQNSETYPALIAEWKEQGSADGAAA